MYDIYLTPCGIPTFNMWNQNDAKLGRAIFTTDLLMREGFADDLVSCLIRMADSYSSENVLMLLGDDFAFMDAK
jgi:hypothetical protein